eukprot:TRINITY_DN744_c0_g1_i2.p1 TRINITY_DN744_c0_g1~~TRINITY_DN744_c0_g1_i2.p1  ORF type:complete len:287 (-),score=64.78 TRINITY_DN744_c0_g1_i2:55-825(-)
MSSDESYDRLYKLLLVGDTGVGKSSLLLRFADDTFDEEQAATIGVDFKVHMMTMDDKVYKLTIWDTAGQGKEQQQTETETKKEDLAQNGGMPQTNEFTKTTHSNTHTICLSAVHVVTERFRTLTSAYYRGAHGCILVYDVTRKETFLTLEIWLNEIQMYATNEDLVIMLVGNKVDCKDIQVTQKEGLAFARNHNMLFIEASAKTKIGVQQAFEELVQKIIDVPSLNEDGVSGKGKHHGKVTVNDDFTKDDQGGYCC